MDERPARNSDLPDIREALDEGPDLMRAEEPALADDFTDSEPPFEPTPREPRRSGFSPLLIVLLVVVLGGVALWLYQRSSPERPQLATTPSTEPATTTPPPTEQAEERPRPELPALEASDPFVRQLVATLSAQPKLIEWLANDQLAERFVAVVDNVARGESPKPHVRFLDPGRGFSAEDTAAGPVVAEESYRRFDLLANAIAALDTAGTAQAFEDLEPLLDEAYRNLGYPDGELRRVMAKAIRQLLATPIPDQPPLLEERIRSYHYKDPAYEDLSPAQKHLLRMGPENIRKVQTKLRQLAVALGLEV